MDDISSYGNDLDDVESQVMLILSFADVILSNLMLELNRKAWAFFFFFFLFGLDRT